MPASIKFDIKNAGVLEDLKKFSKELKVEMTNALDSVLDRAVDELKSNLTVMVNSGINISTTLPDGSKKVPVGLNVPKTRADLVKFIFDEDISKADYFQRSLGNKTVNDTSNVFVYDRGRIKNWQTVTDSSTYASQENNFRERLVNGILIDAASGAMYKIKPDDVKGIKLECSKDTGQSINSEKKFEAYKNGPDIERRKFDAPFTRTAVWTIKQEDAAQLVKGGLPLNQILDRILEGDYKSANEIFTQNNKGGVFNKALEKLDNLEKGTGLSDELQVRRRIDTLIKNIKIKKTISENKVKYTLFSNYDTSIEESEDKFFELMKREVFLWKIVNEDALIKALIKAANKVIGKYTKASVG